MDITRHVHNRSRQRCLTVSIMDCDGNRLSLRLLIASKIVSTSRRGIAFRSGLTYGLMSFHITRNWFSKLALRHIKTHSPATSRLDRMASNSPPVSIPEMERYSPLSTKSFPSKTFIDLPSSGVRLPRRLWIFSTICRLCFDVSLARNFLA